MNIYDKRWNNARNFFQKVLEIAEKGDYVLMFDGVILTGDVKIDDDHREIVIIEDNSTWVVYNGDTDYDEGAHTTSKEWLANMKERFRVFEEVDVMKGI